jgi:TPR repeat protein
VRAFFVHAQNHSFKFFYIFIMDSSRRSSLSSSRRGSGIELYNLKEESSRTSQIFNQVGKLFGRKGSLQSRLSFSSNLSEKLNKDEEGKRMTKAYDVSLLAGYLQEDLLKNSPNHQPATHISKTFSQYYNMAQNVGHAHAKFMVGAYYQFGFQQLPADPVAAYKWYIKAALEGDIRAVNNIGVMLCQGEGFAKKDEVRGAQWLEIAAEAGDENSMMNLSILKTVSEDVAHRNYDEAFAILSNLADEYPSKQVFNNIACMYCRGFGVSLSHSTAIEWFLRASEEDSKIAEYNLGVMYLNGMGVRPDVKEGNYWFKQAKSDPLHEDYKCVIMANDPTKLLMLTTMTYYVPK